MGADQVRVAAISCSHVPHQSSCIHTLLQLLAVLDTEDPLTHFVHLGDLFDAEAASVHDRDDPSHHTLLDEYHEGATLLRSIRDVLNPNCQFTWMLGNHDANIKQRNPKRIPKELRALADWNHVPEVSDEFRKWRQYPYRNGQDGCMELGPLVYYHGYSAATNSDELEGIQMAMACGGHPWRLMVRGHTHRPLPPTQIQRTRRVLLPWYAANVGHTAFDVVPGYMERRSTALWGRGCLLAEAPLKGWRKGKSWQAKLYDLD